jgi:hypothetical protein
LPARRAKGRIASYVTLCATRQAGEKTSEMVTFFEKSMQTKARMIELQARAVDGGPEPVLDDVEIGRVLGSSRTTCRRIGVAILTKCRHR